MYFHTVFRSCRVQKGAFSKAASRRKALYDLEQPSAERERCLKVSGIWQILRNSGLQEELCHSPRFTCLGEWCKADFWGVSSGARVEDEGLGLLGLYFMPCLGVVPLFGIAQRKEKQFCLRMCVRVCERQASRVKLGIFWFLEIPSTKDSPSLIWKKCKKCQWGRIWWSATVFFIALCHL